MTTLQDQALAHIALAATADAIVTDFAAKMLEITASEKALRSAYIDAHPGQATFAKAGQTNLAGYMMTLADRLVAGDARPEFIQPVGDLAEQAWGGVA